MKIAIGTLNKAKISAVEEIIRQVWTDAQFYPIETNSGISAQPLDDEEAIRGAINRAKDAMIKVQNEHHIDIDYGIGLEGTVNSNKYGMFLHGWVAIIDKDQNAGLGQSASMQMPEKIEYRIKGGEELGPIIQELLKDDQNAIRHSQGAGGILTKGMYTRVKEFEDATRCALAKFVNKEGYK